MNSRKAITMAAFSIVLAVALVASAAYADEFDQAMKMTFSQEVAVPGHLLPAGTYWFVRPAHGTTPNALQIFDADKKNVIVTLQTGTEQIAKPSEYITLSMADRSPDRPDAILGIVYPGRVNGHLFELVYSAQERKQFSEYPKITMKVGPHGEMERIEENAGL